MSKSTKSENLAKELKNYLENYVEDISEIVEETSNQIGNEAKNELKQVSPKRTGKYAKGWAVKKDKKNKNYYVVKVWNKTDYQLTHLLEFGHVKRNGTGWVKPSPSGGHIRPVEEKYKKEFEKELKNRIRRESK